jgi:hypothetical protein
MICFLSFLTEKGIIPNLGVIRATGEKKKHDRDIDPYLPGGARHTGEPTHTMAFDHKEIPAGTKVSIVKKEDIKNVTHVHVKPEGTNKVTVVRVDKIHKPIGGRVGKNPEEKEDTAISKLDSQIKKAVEFHGITIYNNDKSFKPENHPLKFIARYASERNDHGIKGARVGIGPASSRKTTELPK